MYLEMTAGFCKSTIPTSLFQINAKATRQLSGSNYPMILERESRHAVTMQALSVVNPAGRHQPIFRRADVRFGSGCHAERHLGGRMLLRYR